jgi:D-alanyl-D-alanine carboxypeptidase
MVRQFESEARQHGAKVIEAEHMLLALATDAGSDAGRLLNDSGLSHGRIESALGEERRRSLAFAGVERLEDNQVEATGLDSALALGTSAKAAIKRALVASREGRPRRPRLQSTDLLLGIIQAEMGTVPRVLAIAGIDRDALVAQTSRPRC